MPFKSFLLALIMGSLFLVLPAEAGPEKVSAPDGCPTITHVPLVTVVRGDPATVVAKIECATGTVLDVKVYVRVLDAGKPSPIEMTKNSEGLYQAVIPISLIRGINRFWYYLDARGKTTPDQAEEGVAQTRWYPVTIVDGATEGGGSGGAAGSKKALYWLLGGAGAVGGAVLWENHNDDGPDHQKPPPMANNPPPSNNSNNNDEQEEEDDDPAPPVTPPCIPTGDASASSASACDTNSPIAVYACSSCPDSLIEISASWGPVVVVNNYNGGCVAEPDPAGYLPQPPNVPSISVGQFTITVRANGQLLGTIPWPDSSYFDCF